MYRMYTITINEDYVSNECSYISYNNINSILDYSADSVSCDVLQMIPSLDKGLIKTLCDKIKPGGIVILTILDLAKVCKDYIDNKISGSSFIGQISNISNPICLEDIYSAISQNISVQQIKYEDNSIKIALTKRGV
jgi:hypothetical protein